MSRPPPADELEVAEQLALELGGDVAFVRAEQGVFYARGRSRPAPSPVLALLRGLYELEPRRARFIARRPVFSTREASSTCAGAARVAARTLRPRIAPVDHGLALAGLPRIDAGAAAPPPRRAEPALEPALAELVRSALPPTDDRAWVALAVRLAGELRGAARGGRGVAALLVDEHGALLGWAANTGTRNPTSHAEVNVVEGWLSGERRALPAGCRVYTTLKPCKMCAGFLWDSAEDPWSLRVFFAEDDPLRYARETVLDARVMARRRVARNERERQAVLQRRL